MKEVKRSIVTPKELAKQRLSRNSSIRVPINERVNVKENLEPQFFPKRKSCYRIHDREVEDHGHGNPYDIPNYIRVFTKSSFKRNTKLMPHIMSEPKTICDTDKTFYKVIEGRPLRQLDDIKVYIRNIRDITLFKANASYLKDQIIQIDNSYSFEVNEYERIKKMYIQITANFVRFVKESFGIAKMVQELAEQKSRELDSMIDQLGAYSFQYVKLRNEFSSLDTTFETLSMYRQFLNKLSPLQWRAKYDQDYVATNYIFSKITSDVSFLSTRYIDIYKTSVVKLRELKPRLFFRRPQQINRIFDDLSRQCLNYMKINVSASTLGTSVVKHKDHLKTTVKADIDELQEFVDIYHGYVDFMEAKEIEIKEKFDKLILTRFQELYASYDTVRLLTGVQFVNTQIFGGSDDPKDNVTALMRQLESLYFELTAGLDNLNQKVVKQATNEFFTEDLKMMKRAHKAQRDIRECTILSKALYTSFEPLRYKRK